MREFSDKILIIDDSVAYYRLLIESMSESSDKSLLEHIIFADCADKGYEQYVIYRPMCVLLDVRMPGKSGIDTAKMLTEYDKQANILLVTNYANDPEVSKAISDKLVNGKMEKSIGIGTITAMISLILNAAGRLT